MDSIKIGDVIDSRYRIEGIIGRGGFGSIYEAEDLEIGRTVALKLMGSNLVSTLDDDKTVERFRREATVAGQINHPNILTIYDVEFSKDATIFYVVMERLRGVDLYHELQTSGAMSVERAVRLMIPALRGLGIGHEQGIVHKDLKPANLFLVDAGSTSERMCIVDFGVARVLHENKHTMTGGLAGTPRYMAPEYVEHGEVTARVDVYQMGVILAEMIQGTPAIPREIKMYACYERSLSGELDLPDLPGELNRVLEQAVARLPRERFEDATEFAEALEAAWLAHDPIEQPFDREDKEIDKPVEAVEEDLTPQAMPVASPTLETRNLPPDRSVDEKPALSTRWVAVLAVVLLVVAGGGIYLGTQLADTDGAPRQPAEANRTPARAAKVGTPCRNDDDCPFANGRSLGHCWDPTDDTPGICTIECTGSCALENAVCIGEDRGRCALLAGPAGCGIGVAEARPLFVPRGRVSRKAETRREVCVPGR